MHYIEDMRGIVHACIVVRYDEYLVIVSKYSINAINSQLSHSCLLGDIHLAIHPYMHAIQKRLPSIANLSTYSYKKQSPHPSSLLPLYRSHYLPLMLTSPKLQIPHALPRPQRQLPIADRNRNTSTYQRALDMCLKVSPTIN